MKNTELFENIRGALCAVALVILALNVERIMDFLRI